MSNNLLTSGQLYLTPEFQALAKILKIDGIENVNSININLPIDNGPVTVDVGYAIFTECDIEQGELKYNVDK